MNRPAHRPSQRAAILAATLTHLREGGILSLETAARAAGVSKPGLMYHFASKEALVAALVDHLVDGYEAQLEGLLEPGASGPQARIAAYARWALTSEHDAADLVMLSDPKLREQMTERWAERFEPWLAVPADLPEDARARLHAVRLLADGAWFADASGFLPIPRQTRPAVLRTALRLLDGEGAA